MNSFECAKFLVLSGSISIFFSAWIGVLMLFMHRPVEGQRSTLSVDFKQIGAAHIDWILLGLMQGLCGVLILLFDAVISPEILWLMSLGAWFNPLAYVFRAFGINAFAFAGPPIQRLAAALGGASSLAILVAWSVVFWTIAQK